LRHVGPNSSAKHLHSRPMQRLWSSISALWEGFPLQFVVPIVRNIIIIIIIIITELWRCLLTVGYTPKFVPNTGTKDVPLSAYFAHVVITGYLINDGQWRIFTMTQTWLKLWCRLPRCKFCNIWRESNCKLLHANWLCLVYINCSLLMVDLLSHTTGTTLASWQLSLLFSRWLPLLVDLHWRWPTMSSVVFVTRNNFVKRLRRVFRNKGIFNGVEDVLAWKLKLYCREYLSPRRIPHEKDNLMRHTSTPVYFFVRFRDLDLWRFDLEMAREVVFDMIR